MFNIITFDSVFLLVVSLSLKLLLFIWLTATILPLINNLKCTISPSGKALPFINEKKLLENVISESFFSHDLINVKIQLFF